MLLASLGYFLKVPCCCKSTVTLVWEINMIADSTKASRRKLADLPLAPHLRLALTSPG